MKKNKIWGIKYSCPGCKKLIKFPATPDADINKHEALAHAIYTCIARNRELCYDCKQSKRKQK